MEEGKVVKKHWGEERYITNTPHYCCKQLIVEPLKICSLHRHFKKQETFYVTEGDGFIELEQNIIYVQVGDHVHIDAMEWHRFWTVNGMHLLEISTHHEDADVHRWTNSSDVVSSGPVLGDTPLDGNGTNGTSTKASKNRPWYDSSLERIYENQ